MKKIWYLKDEQGQNVKAVKLFLYEKNGRISGKMDLSVFRGEGSQAEKDMVLIMQDVNNREVGVVDLSDRMISREAFLQGKGQLKEELAGKIGAAKGDVRLSVIVGEERYFSEGWQTQETAAVMEPQRKEKSIIKENKTDTIASEERNIVFPEEEREQMQELEAEELLPEETGDRRIVQLATLEEELTFRNYIHNSFLLHGYYNYGHVIIDETGEEPRLGVPGNYYEREQMVAAMFGFPDFEPAREGEKVSNGTFGYFYTQGKR